MKKIRHLHPINHYMLTSTPIKKKALSMEAEDTLIKSITKYTILKDKLSSEYRDDGWNAIIRVDELNDGSTTQSWHLARLYDPSRPFG